VSDQDNGKRPTLKDVAELAGVSPMTVSRAIRGSAPVSAGTKARIDKAIGELGYTPNRAARQLVRGEGVAQVGLMLHTLSHPTWSRIAFAMQADLVRHGFASVAVDTRGRHAEEARQLEHLLERGVCGVVASPGGLDYYLPNLVRAQDLPVVIINSRSDGELDAVAVDEAAGMKQLTEHLLAHGHRRIALLHRTPHDFPAAERRRGYKAALQAAGVPIDPQLIQVSENEAGEAATYALLDNPAPPTAIIAGAPWAAFDILYALSRRRIVVPDEIEVAVYGEMPTFGDRLTRASYEPVDELGKRAAEMLVERINGYRGPAREYIQPVKVIPRRPQAGPALE
jgi:LacI family transcriptional regulator